MTRAVLKMLGGKSWLAPEIEDELAALRSAGYPIRRFWEPFCGSCAVSMHLADVGALKGVELILNDTERDMIDLYRALGTDARKVYESLLATAKLVQAAGDDITAEIFDHGQPKIVRGPEAAYYRLRAAYNVPPSGESNGALAGTYWFLRRAAHNGVMRRRGDGQFNVPPGSHVKGRKPVPLPSLNEAVGFGRFVSHAQLSAVDFRQLETLYTPPIGTGDVVYCDPPYHGAGVFNGYGAGGFTAVDHRALISLAAEWTRRGAYVIYSNAAGVEVDAWLRELWPNARVEIRLGPRKVSRTGDRTPVKEVFVRGVEMSGPNGAQVQVQSDTPPSSPPACNTARVAQPQWEAPILLESNIGGRRQFDLTGGLVAFVDAVNDTGKSMILRSITAAITGVVPDIEKTGKSLMRLAPKGETKLFSTLTAPNWKGLFQVERGSRPNQWIEGALGEKTVPATKRDQLLPISYPGLRGLIDLEKADARAEVFRLFGGPAISLDPPDALVEDQKALWIELLKTIDEAGAAIADEVGVDEPSEPVKRDGKKKIKLDPAEKLAALVKLAGRLKKAQGETDLERSIATLNAKLEGTPDPAILDGLRNELHAARRWEEAAVARGQLAEVDAKISDGNARIQALIQEQQQVAANRAALEAGREQAQPEIDRLSDEGVKAEKLAADLERDVIGYRAVIAMFARAEERGGVCKLVITAAAHVHELTRQDLEAVIAPTEIEIAAHRAVAIERARAIAEINARIREADARQSEAERDISRRIESFRQAFGGAIALQTKLRAIVGDAVQPMRSAAVVDGLIKQVEAAQEVRKDIAKAARDLDDLKRKKAAAKAVETAADQRLTTLLETTKKNAETAVNEEIMPGLKVEFDAKNGRWQVQCRDGEMREKGLAAGYAEASLMAALALAFRDPTLPAIVVLDAKDLAEFAAVNVRRVLSHFAELKRQGRLTAVYVAWSRPEEIPEEYRVYRLDQQPVMQSVQGGSAA